MTEEQIKKMVDRFLQWKLPEDFNPDGGISFDPIMNQHTDFPSRREPSGTNLFHWGQAEQMVRFMVADIDTAPDTVTLKRGDAEKLLVSLKRAYDSTSLPSAAFVLSAIRKLENALGKGEG